MNKPAEWGKIECLGLITVLVMAGWETLTYVGSAIGGPWFVIHEDFCFLVWILMPIVAFRLSSEPVRSRLQLSIPILKLLRGAMVALATLMSLGFLIHNILNTIDPEHWYGSIGVTILKWLFLAVWVFVPLPTWVGTTKALNQAMTESTTNRDMDDGE